MPEANAPEIKMPEFDDVLKAVGATVGEPDPRQDHIINTLAQISMSQNIQIQAGSLAAMDKLGHPGNLKMLWEQAMAFKLHADGLLKFIQEVAKALGQPVPTPDEVKPIKVARAAPNVGYPSPSAIVPPKPAS